MFGLYKFLPFPEALYTLNPPPPYPPSYIKYYLLSVNVRFLYSSVCRAILFVFLLLRGIPLRVSPSYKCPPPYPPRGGSGGVIDYSALRNLPISMPSDLV